MDGRTIQLILLWGTVIAVYGSVYPIDTLKCVYLGGRNVVCHYDVPEDEIGDYTCSMTPIGSDGPCVNVSSSWRTITESGLCNYTCNSGTCMANDDPPCGMCRRDRIAVKVTHKDQTASCRVFHLDKLFKPEPVRNLVVDRINGSRVFLNWTRPSDYPMSVKRYEYIITVVTDAGDSIIYKKKSKNLDVRRKIKIRTLQPWKQLNISVTAKSTRGDYSSDPVFTSAGNDTISEVVITYRTNESIWIPVLVLGVAAAVALPLSIWSYRRNPKCCEKIAIMLPKFDDSIMMGRDEILHTSNSPTRVPLISDSTEKTAPDSGRGSMESNDPEATEALNGGSTQKEKDLIQDPQGIYYRSDSSSHAYVHKGQNEFDASTSGNLPLTDELENEENVFMDSGGSIVSVYRQTAKVTPEETIGEETLGEETSGEETTGQLSDTSDVLSSESYSVFADSMKSKSMGQESELILVRVDLPGGTSQGKFPHVEDYADEILLKEVTGSCAGTLSEESQIPIINEGEVSGTPCNLVFISEGLSEVSVSSLEEQAKILSDPVSKKSISNVTGLCKNHDSKNCSNYATIYSQEFAPVVPDNDDSFDDSFEDSDSSAMSDYRQFAVTG